MLIEKFGIIYIAGMIITYNILRLIPFISLNILFLKRGCFVRIVQRVALVDKIEIAEALLK